MDIFQTISYIELSWSEFFILLLIFFVCYFTFVEDLSSHKRSTYLSVQKCH